MTLKNKYFKEHYSSLHGFSLMEVLVVCFVGVIVSALAFRQFQSDQQLKKVASIRSNIAYLHQGAQQLTKKWEMLQLQTWLSTNPRMNNCYKNSIGTDCTDLVNLRQPIVLHPLGPLSPLQVEENSYLNGGFNLDGTRVLAGSPCNAPDSANCPIQTVTTLSFDNCSANSCSGIKYQISTRINANVLNPEDRVSFASIPPVESEIVSDATEDRGLASTTEGCGAAVGVFGFNAHTKLSLCDVNAMPSPPLIFDGTFGGTIQNGELTLVAASTGGTTTSSISGGGSREITECTPPEILKEIKEDGTLHCERPKITTCEGEFTFSNGQVLSTNIGNEDFCLIRIPAGVTVKVIGSVTLHAQEVELFGHLDGNGGGHAGGKGGRGGRGGAGGDVNGCRGAGAHGGAPGAPGYGPRAPGGRPAHGSGKNIQGSGGNGGQGGSGAANSGHWEAPGGGGGGGGGAGGAAISIIANNLTLGGAISVLGLANGGHGSSGNTPPDNYCGGLGGLGGAGATPGTSLGSGVGGAGVCHYRATGCGSNGSNAGRGGDGSIYIEYTTKVGALAAINRGFGFYQEIVK